MKDKKAQPQLSPLNFDDYRSFLLELVNGESAYRGLRTQLAQAMRCQPAYFTQVLANKAELTEEQGYRLGQFLRFSLFETEYFSCLLRFAKSGDPELRAYLQEQRISIRARASQLKNRSDAASLEENEAFKTRYFSNWIPSAVHLATSSPAYQTPTAIAKRLGISTKAAQQELQWLKKHGLVAQNEGKKWHFRGASFHLPKESDLDVNHQTMRRMQAIQAVHSRGKNLHFSSLFTLDEKHYRKVKQALASAIESAQKETR